MIVGAYGRKFNVKPSEHEPSDCIKDRNFNDLSSLFEVQMGDEAYIEFLLEHCDLDVDDLLYCCFEGDELKGTDGVEFHSPPVFILRDRVKQTIVVLIRGTQNLNDVIVDVYGNSMRWEEGAVHEGMGMIARWVATDNIIVSTIEDALINNVNYSITVVGHSLGASIAALTAIYWKNHKTFRKFERSYKNGQFLQCFAFAPAPMLSRQIKEKGLGFVVSIVNEDDVVPRLNVQCIYDIMNVVESCVEEREEQTKEKEKEDVQVMLRHERLRKSLRVIDHSYKKDDNEHQSFKLKMKSIFGRKIQEITESFKNFENNLKNGKDKPNDETPIFGDFVLPGTIYLLHPYIANGDSYVKYEEMKSQITSVRLDLLPHS